MVVLLGGSGGGTRPITIGGGAEAGGFRRSGKGGGHVFERAGPGSDSVIKHGAFAVNEVELKNLNFNFSPKEF